MKYQVIRTEHGEDTILMQCDFEDKEKFVQIAESHMHKILCKYKDVTVKYRKKKEIK